MVDYGMLVIIVLLILVGCAIYFKSSQAAKYVEQGHEKIKETIEELKKEIKEEIKKIKR